MPEKDLDKFIELAKEAFSQVPEITLAEAVGALELIKNDIMQDAREE